MSVRSVLLAQKHSHVLVCACVSQTFQEGALREAGNQVRRSYPRGRSLLRCSVLLSGSCSCQLMHFLWPVLILLTGLDFLAASGAKVRNFKAVIELFASAAFSGRLSWQPT